MTRSFWVPPVVVIVAALVLLLTGAAAWVATTEERSVGEVVVTEPDDISGTQFAPEAVVAGLAGLVAGVALALVRGKARRVVAAATAVIGVVGVAVVAVGLFSAAQSGGRLTPAPLFAVVAALAVAAGGSAALRGPARPPIASRYRVAEEQSGDDEWSLASGDGYPAIPAEHDRPDRGD